MLELTDLNGISFTSFCFSLRPCHSRFLGVEAAESCAPPLNLQLSRTASLFTLPGLVERILNLNLHFPDRHFDRLPKFRYRLSVVILENLFHMSTRIAGNRTVRNQQIQCLPAP